MLYFASVLYLATIVQHRFDLFFIFFFFFCSFILKEVYLQMARNFVASKDVLQQVFASSGESGSKPDRDVNFNVVLDTFSLNSSSDDSKNNDRNSLITPNQGTSSNMRWSWRQTELHLQNFSFLGNSGLHVSLDENSSALDIFSVLYLLNCW